MDADTIARECVGRPITNTAMVGALVRCTGILKFDNVRDELRATFGNRFKASVVEGNIRPGTSLRGGCDRMKIRRIDNFGEMPTVSQVPLGGILTNVGTGPKYRTGSWRTQRPISTPQPARNCLLCWINCPDGSIAVAEGKVTGIDEMHCKGCGICA